ncbi:Mu transposase C-terminal domain-containing protein [Ktedonospora formicarum]|uniref:Mu transposase C-terminal domain-containing protein n=1 Tax=Ktedonospora formicarum TaxID=2778364 RepID=UPI001C68DAA9|nr:Mu transposase C-terminal domain-containing protein [Ktedonospora formicarum]
MGAPDDLKLLLMKAQNRKLSSRAYRVHDRSRLSFQGNWYVSPGLLNRLAGREFEIYYDRRDVSVIYLFVEGSYVGEAYCPAFMGQRVSEWEAKAMRQADTKSAKAASAEVANARAQIQEDIETTKKQRGKALRQREKARQLDRQREEIHPSYVAEALEGLAPAARESLQLAEAIPDSEKVYSWEPLAIRYREKEGGW